MAKRLARKLARRLARRLAVLHPVILESPIAHSFLPFSVVPAVRERLAWREGADCDTANVHLVGVWLGRGGGGVELVLDSLKLRLEVVKGLLEFCTNSSFLSSRD